MINRVLIRIKVVQMLYSYLLTRSEFKINSAPESTSRDKRYAWRTYVDMLMLILELSGYSVKTGQKPPQLVIAPKLASNGAAKALMANDEVKTLILRDQSQVAIFDPILQKLVDKIETSKIFVDYCKKQKKTLGDDVLLWTVLLETTLSNDPEITAILRAQGDYSRQGFLSGIRDLCMTLRAYVDSRELYLKAKADLETSLTKAYELYLSLFALILDLTAEQERRIEQAKSKHLASSADLNPNTRLIDNDLAAYLKSNESLEEKLKEYKVQRCMPGDPLLKTLLDQILDSEAYKNYIASDEHGLKADTEFWREIMRTVILPSDALAEEMEDKSVYWNDDLQIMGTFALKTLRQIAQSEGEEITLLNKFKDEEDAKFGSELFALAVQNQEQYREYVQKFVKTESWDPGRLAYMDMVILTCAIAEIINYPAIPIPVSVNEYVEIANCYSTDKSGGFVNGILYSVTKHLTEQGIINK